MAKREYEWVASPWGKSGRLVKKYLPEKLAPGQPRMTIATKLQKSKPKPKSAKKIKIHYKVKIR